MDGDFTLNVRQIAQYQFAAAAAATDAILIQQGGIGGAYAYTSPAGLVAPAIAANVTTSSININGAGPITWGQGQVLSSNGSGFQFNWPSTGLLFNIGSSGDANLTGELSVGRDPLTPFEVATKNYTDASIATAKQLLTDNSVWTVNGRNGNINLTWWDLIQMGGAPLDSPVFRGIPTTPPIMALDQHDFQIATTAFVQDVSAFRIGQLLKYQPLVFTFDGRTGDVCLTVDDVNVAYFQPGANPQAPTLASSSDASNSIATTLFVSRQIATVNADIAALQGAWEQDIADSASQTLATVAATYAPINNPNLSGVPTAPTAAPGASTSQIATTAFVHAAVTAATTGVASFNTRTGAVVLTSSDITAASGAVLASPNFTGVPTAPTATVGTNTTQLATTAYVLAALPAPGVTSFNTRSGAVSLQTADVTGVGGALLASPTFTGTPQVPTAATNTNTTQIASTAFVIAQIAAGGGTVAGVSSFEGRTGAVTLLGNDISAAGGALLASPAFTGTPTVPLALPGANDGEIASTLWVNTRVAALGAVSSFNSRTGAVVLTTADVTGVGGAPIASPSFTGTPLAPTAAPGTNTTQLATTAFVEAAMGAGGGVTSFNTRIGAVVLTAADVSGVGGAMLASPTFTGTPSGPTATAGTSTTQFATTAFVTAAIGTGGVASFNGRTGAVNLIANDVSAVGGALLASPTFTGTPAAPTATSGTSTTQLATTAFVMAALSTAGGVTSFNSRAGAVTLQAADLTAAGGALLAGPTFTGIPAAPTPAQTTNTTQLATTAFVTTKVAGYLPLAGGTMSGVLTINVPSATNYFPLVLTNLAQGNVGVTGTGTYIRMNYAVPVANRASGAGLISYAGANTRWELDLGNGNAETGSNAGSDFAISNYNDAGTALGTPFQIYRSSGVVQISAQDFGTTGFYPELRFAMTAGSGAVLSSFMGANLRWDILLGNGAGETGGNAGNDFAIDSYSDAGALLATPMSIVRATGITTFAHPIVNGPSDLSLKENIAPLQDALAKTCALRGVSFNFIGEEAERIGLIAQDVEHVAPQAIQQFGHDGLLAIDHPQLIALLIEAVKTLASRLERLETRTAT